jgi:co-chaperonin GroES (HSP10)
MQVSNSYIVVEKVEQEKKEGFQTVDATDESTFKGRVTYIPEAPVYMGNSPIQIGDVILFAKYSPDTHDVELEGKKLKFVSTRDILAKL